MAFNYRISIGQTIQVEERMNAPFEAVRLHGIVTHVIPSPDPQQPPNEVRFVADHAVLESTGKWIPYTCEGNYELWNWDWKFEHEQLVRRRACRAIVTACLLAPAQWMAAVPSFCSRARPGSISLIYLLSLASQRLSGLAGLKSASSM